MLLIIESYQLNSIDLLYNSSMKTNDHVIKCVQNMYSYSLKKFVVKYVIIMIKFQAINSV